MQLAKINSLIGSSESLSTSVLYRTDVSLTLRNLLLLPAKPGYVTILHLLILFIDIILISFDRKFTIITYKQLRYRYLANHLIFPNPSFKSFFVLLRCKSIRSANFIYLFHSYNYFYFLLFTHS